MSSIVSPANLLANTRLFHLQMVFDFVILSVATLIAKYGIIVRYANVFMRESRVAVALICIVVNVATHLSPIEDHCDEKGLQLYLNLTNSLTNSWDNITQLKTR